MNTDQRTPGRIYSRSVFICVCLWLILPGSARGYLGERVTSGETPGKVRWLLNVPGDFDPAKATEHVIYLLPNGNSIEQTLGKQLEPGMDWHFDIQHIAAQVRLLRKMDPGHNYVVTLLEAPGKSWPKYRADHADNPARIRAMIAEAEKRVPASNAQRVSLVAHSGGGSFLFGYLNSEEKIGAEVERIVWLDANYSYSDDDRHGDKLIAWLNGSPDRRVVVFAYDDRNVTLGGKKIVSETGGTWRASQRMMDRFAREGETAKTDQAGPFEHASFFDGQVQFYRHPNPELKILHTAMIGEMNAFLQAMTIGTEMDGKWGALGGPRAYTQYVEAAPATRPEVSAVGRELKLPARAANALGGAAIVEKVKGLTTVDREKFLEKEVLAGNVPESMRHFVPVSMTAAGGDTQHTATFYVSPDVLEVGSEQDSFRIPLTPIGAQRIASAVDCSLVTRKVSNDIYANAAVKIEPRPFGPPREAVETFYRSDRMIEGQLKQEKGYKPGVLVGGQKKDVVITPRMKEKPGKVAIYGWHKLDGKAIQPLYLGHADWYVDYSHGIRLMSNHLVVDGKETTVAKVLADPNLAPLLSDEGVIATPRYPANFVTTHP